MKNQSRSKIFGIGLSRTGTTSLNAALKELGYRTLHFSLPAYAQRDRLFGLPPVCPQAARGWQERFILSRELKAQRAKDVRSIFNNYDAFCDLPFPLFYQELDERFPGSKFILTTRPLNAWLKSMNWLIEEGRDVWNHGYLDRELLFDAYGTHQFNPTVLTKAWHRHHDAVRGYFADRSDDLLVMDMAAGDFTFEKLCSFLGSEPLAGAFPRSNEARTVDRAGKRRWAFLKFPLVEWFLMRGLK